MQYTAGQAAAATGKNIATITRAIKSGKISAFKDDSGAWSIDPAELHRVFSPVTKELRKPIMQERATDTQDAQTPFSDNALREELASLRERIKAQDEILHDRAETITDLRTRLDREGEERRKLATLLTYEVPLKIKEKPSQSWWQRLIR
jgi:hypothetical protein